MQPSSGDSREQGLRHQLGAGQMAMVAVGGSIGTGLLLGSGAAIKIAGPGVIFSFLLAACINWTIAVALGELASAHPAAGSFGVYGELYLNHYTGFLARAGYWIAISLSVGVDMVAAATYMKYWFPTVPAVVWVSLFSVVMVMVNLRSVGEYGWFEFWFAMIKLVTILLFVIIGVGLLLSRHVPAQYTAQGGFLPNGPWSPLMAMAFAMYTFAGVEFVAVTTGESRSRKEISRAVWLTFGMLCLVYLGAILVLVGVMPWNQAGVAESPFVTVFRHAGIPATGHVMNFVVLTAALSGANAAIYIASRMLFAMARSGQAPARLGQLNALGSPTAAVLVSSYAIVIALALEKWAPADAFANILNSALFGLLLAWLVSLAAHVVFRRKLARDKREPPVRSAGGVWSSIAGFALICIALVETWYASHVPILCGVVYIGVLSLIYFLMKKGAAKRTISA